MLSRVAAVKAPRTRNCRGVTGSSGRRREGGESELQRRNMSRHLFCSAVLPLLFMMMCCGTGGAAEIAGQSTVSKFEWKDVKIEDETVESLGAAGLLNVGSDVFAVAEAQCKKDSVIFTGVASQTITKDNANTPVEVLNEVKGTRFLEDGSEVQKKKVDVSRPTTVVQENDIYVLVGKYSQAAVGAQNSGAEDCGLLLVKGNVSEENSGEKRIHWKDNDDVSRISVGELDSWTRLFGSGGSGIKMKDGTLVFPVEGTKKEG
ncbi:trans-sialidase, partial [Trypanosoma cruzi]